MVLRCFLKLNDWGVEFFCKIGGFVLDSIFMMRLWQGWKLGLVLLLVVAGRVGAQSQPLPVIISPEAGAWLQGAVSVRGSTALDGFSAMEVAFAYADDPTETWFLLVEGQQSVIEGDLALWDTTALPDGNYILRVRVILKDVQVRDALIEGLRVRNYSPIETRLPTIGGTPGYVLMATVQPSPTMPVVTPTPLALNPAQVSLNDWLHWLKQGALIGLGLLLGMGFYLLIRRLRR